MGPEEHGGLERPFRFVQMADTQLGMEAGFLGAGNSGWDLERQLAERAARAINRLRPAFAIVCGDLVNEFPPEERRSSPADVNLREQQEKDFKAAMSLIDPDIPLLCLCGNHDVGNRPNAQTIERYVSSLGDDYFTFWCHGVKCLVVNSQLWKDDADAKEAREAMDKWLDAELAAAEPPTADVEGAGAEAGADDSTSRRRRRRRRLMVFSHIPPFIFDPEERDGYFNLDRDMRLPLLSRLSKAGCCSWFCGHYHRNAGGVYRDPDPAVESSLEVVVTGAVGCQIVDNPVGDPLELSGIGKHKIGQGDSGLRVVDVSEDRGVEHTWLTFDQLDAEREGAGSPSEKRPRL